MKKQKVMSQMNRQDKTPEKQLNEAEIGSHPEKRNQNNDEKMIQNLRKRMKVKIEKVPEMFIKDLEELKNKQTEMNNTLEGIHNRVTEAEAWINDLEDRIV